MRIRLGPSPRSGMQTITTAKRIPLTVRRNAPSGPKSGAAAKPAVDRRRFRRLIQQYTRTPFYGVRRMTEWLRTAGHAVNHKRVARLLRLMGIEAIYPCRRLSQPAPGHRIYPYVLRGVSIERPDQVWSTDITYIRVRRGCAYLVAVLD